MNLCIRDGDLESRASGETDQDLVADPFASRSVGIHGVQESRANGRQCTAKDPERRHDTDLRQCKALDDGGESQWENQCEHPDTRSDRTGFMNTLEIDRKVIQEHEIATPEEEHEDGANPDVALHELRFRQLSRSVVLEVTYQARNDHGTLFLEHLP